MKPHAAEFFVLVILSPLAMPAPAFAGCDVQSGRETAALVELYTSEGCSSCPPADLRLNHLPQALDRGATAIPLALHVGYWDYLGWNDPFAQQAFARRQEWLVRLNHHVTVYTPHFFVGGAELEPQPPALIDQIRRVNAAPAGADIRLRATLGPDATLAVTTDAVLRDKAAPVALFVAVTESGLTTKVARGENAGVTLNHDHVVRAWVGPIPISDGAIHAQREFVLPEAWNRDRLDVVAVVENQHTGAVLQAVSAASCARS